MGAPYMTTEAHNEAIVSTAAFPWTTANGPATLKLRHEEKPAHTNSHEGEEEEGETPKANKEHGVVAL